MSKRNGPGLARAFIAFTGVAMAGAALAATLEEVPGRAWIGQPLDFPLRLQLQPGEALEPECLRVDVVVGERNPLPAQVRHEALAPGQYLLRVQSRAPVTEPLLAVQLQAGCSWRVTRRFVVLADLQPPELQFSPPGAGSGTSAASAPARPAPGPRSSLRMDAVDARTGAAAAGAAATGRMAPAAAAGLSPEEVALVEQALAAVVEAGAVVRSAQAAASAAQSRALGLERTVQQLRAEAQAHAQAESALRQRLQQSESRSDWIWPLALGGLGLAALAAWLAWQLAALRKTQASAQPAGSPGQAQAAALQAAALAAGQASRPAGADAEPGQTAQERTEAAERTTTAPSPFSVSVRPGEQGTGSSLFGNSPGMGPDTEPALLSPSPQQGSTLERAREFAASAPSGLDSLGAMRTRPLSAAPSLGQLLASAPGAPARDLSIEELIDLEQQAEFFIVLGQEEAAVDLLVENIRSSGGASPLPYLKLLEIYRRRGDREAYERTRTRFNQRFNAYAAEWSEDPLQGLGLEDYPDVLPALVAAWPRPLDAMAALEVLLFRRAQGELFALPAYRELLFLYALARDLLDREAAGSGQVDLLLPLPEAPRPAAPARPAADAPAPAAESDLAQQADSPEAGAAAPSSTSVDLELAQEPARKRIFDALRSSRLPGFSDRQP